MSESSRTSKSSSRRSYSAPITAAVLLILGSVATAPCLASDFRLSLDRQSPLPESMRFVGVGPECRATPGPDGLELSIDEGRPAGPVGIALIPWFEGDFEVSVSYRVRRIGPPSSGYGAGFGLAVELDGDGDPAVALERQVSPGDEKRYVSTLVDTDETSQRRYRSEVMSARGEDGELRIQRVGSVVHTAVVEPGAGGSRTIRTLAVGTDPVRSLKVTAFTGGAACSVSVLVTELRIRADKTTEPRPRRAHLGPSGAFWRRLSVASLINLILLAGMAAFHFGHRLDHRRRASLEG